MQKSPTQVPYILFDYTKGSCEINLRALDHEELDSEFAYDVTRAECTGGRMQLRLMKVVEGEDTRIWSFPLPLSEEFLEELRAIADILPEGTSSEALEDRVRKLINLTDNPTN
ncbi:hypothetical protein K438DRAFT_1756207 [Mycena galopus ATCC 62051]|nr:hypothetical protein K438DRAFT_1756207 [Mycena galopus ATCC 62051]